ncbi:hypothetical protein [Lentzea flava]|uniref:DUF4240 domain-containing protein n=1 Tax=Lentzea flava TaxID=103732 RepID=A0ABQ2V214_9PSEU|nr:hypothetical protein [Lentzea flava]MCP2202902.1 hypothetical protein [Lentzea flava]GGU62998.1 hypothetical protein GCM10010178_63910 [Lentzea flava]
MKGCLYCWTQAELDALDGDPELVPDEIVRQFARETPDHFDRDEYELAWRRLAHRIVQVLEREPDSMYTSGLEQAGWTGWPEDERAAFRALVTGVVVRAAEDEERWPSLDDLIQAAAQLDQNMNPWLRLVESFPDGAFAHMAEYWSRDLLHSSNYGTWLFWKDPAAGEQIEDWLLTTALRDRLSAMDSAVARSAVEQIGVLAEISTR